MFNEFDDRNGGRQHCDGLPSYYRNISVSDGVADAVDQPPRDGSVPGGNGTATGNFAEAHNRKNLTHKSNSPVTGNCAAYCDQSHAGLRSDNNRAHLQHIEDLIADALYDHETGTSSHRRQAEAVLAVLLARGLNTEALDLS